MQRGGWVGLGRAIAAALTLSLLGSACGLLTASGATGGGPSLQPPPHVTYTFTTKPPTSPPPSSPPVTVSPTIDTSPSTIISPTADPDCPPSPKLGLYNPDVFVTLAGCQWFAGTVNSLVQQRDLDWALELKPDAGYETMLNAGDNGMMVVQIMPGQHFRLPGIGEHISVFGTLELNTNTGANEMHPIWSILYSLTGIRVDSLPPRTPVFTP